MNRYKAPRFVTRTRLRCSGWVAEHTVNTWCRVSGYLYHATRTR